MSGIITRAVRAVTRPQDLDITTSAELEAFLRKGARSWSGIDVTHDNAMTVSAVFDAVRVISEDIGKLPFIVTRKSADGQTTERARESRYWSLLHDAPNPFQTSQEFRETLTAWALTRGDGFALKVPAGFQWRELIPVPAGRVRIEQLPDFTLLYHVRMPEPFTDPETGRELREATLTRREVFHLRGISLNGYSGVSPITLARQGIALAMATERHGATFFGNGAHPIGGFKHPGELSDTAYTRLKESLKEELGGDNSNSPLLLEDGLEWTPFSLSNEDSQFLETRKFQVAEIARWFRVPPHKLGDLERATFDNIEHQALEYVSDTLLAWAERWRHAVKQQLLAGPDARDLEAELLFDALLRGDIKSRYEATRIAAGGPWITRNEARRINDLNALDDPDLDVVITPRNVEAGDPGAPGSPSPDRTGADRV